MFLGNVLNVDANVITRSLFSISIVADSDRRRFSCVIRVVLPTYLTSLECVLSCPSPSKVPSPWICRMPNLPRHSDPWHHACIAGSAYISHVGKLENPSGTNSLKDYCRYYSQYNSISHFNSIFLFTFTWALYVHATSYMRTIGHDIPTSCLLDATRVSQYLNFSPLSISIGVIECNPREFMYHTDAINHALMSTVACYKSRLVFSRILMANFLCSFMETSTLDCSLQLSRRILCHDMILTTLQKNIWRHQRCTMRTSSASSFTNARCRGKSVYRLWSVQKRLHDCSYNVLLSRVLCVSQTFLNRGIQSFRAQRSRRLGE